MNTQLVDRERAPLRGPCGNVNYVTDFSFEQDVLTGALIELARTLEQGGEEVMPELSELMLVGLCVSGSAERVPVQEIRATTVRVVGALMQRTSRRTRPPFDMRAFWESPDDDLCAMKTLVLLGLRGVADTALRDRISACRDRLLNRILVATLTALAEIKRPALLLPIARDIGRINFRCLDRASRRRREASRGETRRLGWIPAGEVVDRMPMRDASEAEGAVLALGTERNLRALRRRDARPSVALSWYGPASVCMLFTLLALGVRDIRLGPDRPTFVAESVAEELETYFELEGSLFV